MKTLFIQLKNMREVVSESAIARFKETQVKRGIDRAINVLKNKLIKKLKKSQQDHPEAMYKEIKLDDGVRIEIIGPSKFIDKEYILLDDEWQGLDSKVGGQKGKQAIITAGISFLYWVEDEDGQK